MENNKNIEYKECNYYVHVAKQLGINSAILLSYLIKLNNTRGIFEGDYFCTTTQEIYENTALSYENQRTALNKLKNFGVVEVVRMGMPAKNYYRLIK